MSELSSAEKEAIKKRRSYRCDRDGRNHRSKNIEIHHKDRNRHHNTPKNIRLLCIKHHDDLHRRAGH